MYIFAFRVCTCYFINIFIFIYDMLGIMLCIGQATRQKSYMYVTLCTCLITCRTCSVGHARWWNGSNTLKQHPAVSLIIITPTPPIFNTHVYLCDVYNFTSSTSIWVEQSPPHSSPAIPWRITPIRKRYRKPIIWLSRWPRGIGDFTRHTLW